MPKLRVNRRLTAEQQRLAAEHVGLVRKILGRYDEDIQQHGAMILSHCAATYRPDRGVTFEQYAFHRIRQAPIQYFRECGRPMREPRKGGVRHEFVPVDAHEDDLGCVDPGFEAADARDAVYLFLSRFQCVRACVLAERFGIYRDGHEQVLREIAQNMGFSESVAGYRYHEGIEMAREFFRVTLEPLHVEAPTHAD